MKVALRMIYPAQCMACGIPVEQEGSLCPVCWRDCEFISGCSCRTCGVPLPGYPEMSMTNDLMMCDDCLRSDRPWQQACASLVYSDVARDLVLLLKHGGRVDLARPLGDWLAHTAGALIKPEMIVVPVPLHPFRMVSRKYNQAALLAARVAKMHGLSCCPAMLRRNRPTAAQDHRSYTERYDNLRNAFSVNNRYRGILRGRPVLLVDDVMASGATVTEAAYTLINADAGEVSLVVLARTVTR